MTILSDILGAPPTTFLNYKGGCAKCPRKLVGFVPATLTQAPVIFVGDAPGAADEAAQEYFAGEDGQYLKGLLAECGITSAAFSNVVHCRPADDSPKDREIECCMAQHTTSDVRGYSIVVLLGATAFRAFYPGKDITHFRGNLAYHPDYPGQRFFTTRHPRTALGSPQLKSVFEKHIQRVARILSGEPLPFRLHTPSSPDYYEVLEAGLKERIFSFDFETEGVETWNPKTRVKSLALSFSTEDVIAVHRDDPAFWTTLGAIAARFSDEDVQVTGRHVGFDLVLLERESGLRFRGQARELGTLFYQSDGYREASMKQLVSEQLDGYRHLVPEPHNETDVDRLLVYNAEDVHYGHKLLLLGLSRLKPKTLDLYLRVASQTELTCARMTHKGIVINTPAVLSAQKLLEERRQQAIDAWTAMDPRFIPAVHQSGKGFEEYAFQICGLPVVKKTAKAGKPAVDDDVLQHWLRSGLAPWVNQAIEIRSIDKERSTFVDPFLTKYMAEDGRSHASYFTDSTDTGRLSSRNPNDQNQPRKKYIRAQRTVPPGYVFFQGDFSQIELRIGMCLAQDPVGIAAYNSGMDAHYTTAQRFAGENPTKEQRTWAKAINFALLFGGGPSTVQSYAQNVYQITFTQQQSEEFHYLFFDTYKRLPEWHKRSNEILAANEGHFISPVGHCFYYKGWNSKDEALRSHVQRAHINSQCQGTAAYFCAYTMNLADRMIFDAGLDAYIIGSVHDSILVEVRDGLEAEVAAILNAAVAKVKAWVQDWFVVPLVMDFEVGPDWGHLKELAG